MTAASSYHGNTTIDVELGQKKEEMIAVFKSPTF